MYRRSRDGYWEWFWSPPMLFTPYPLGGAVGSTASLPTSQLDHELLRATGRTLENWQWTQALCPSIPTCVLLDSGLTEVIEPSAPSTQEER